MQSAAAATQQALDSTCQEEPTQTPVTVAPACRDALNTLTTNIAGCAPTAENPQLFCTGDCRGYYDAVVDNCDAAVSQTVSYVATLCKISCVCVCAYVCMPSVSI